VTFNINIKSVQDAMQSYMFISDWNWWNKQYT